MDKIDVKFNTEGKQDMQTKKITIIANTFPAETEIILRGMVKVKSEKWKVKSEKTLKIGLLVPDYCHFSLLVFHISLI